MKISFLKAVFLFASTFSLSFSFSQTFTWSGLPNGATNYVNGNLTTTISGVNFSNTSGTSPAFANPNGCAIGNALYIAHDWSNVSSSTTITFTFATPVGAPVTFNIGDLNSNYCNTSAPFDCYFLDEVAISATTGTGAAVTPTTSGLCSGQTSSTSGTTRVVRADLNTGGSGGCTCSNFTVSVGSAGQCIKTMTLVYRNNQSAGSIYQGNPRFQYILIGSIATAAPLNPNVAATPSPATICAGQTSTLSASCSSNCTGITYAWSGGTTPTTGASVSASPASTTNYTVTGTNGGGCITTQNVAINVNCTLPVELSDFKVNCKNDIVKLNWMTESEENNDYFVIQGSVDGLLFDDLNFIKGAGNSQDQVFYEKEIERNKYNYFRLKQVDFDGTETISNLLQTNCNNTQTDILEIFPNPFTDNFNLSLDLVFASDVTFQIVNQQGEIVEIIEENLENGNTILNDFFPNHLEKGIYFIKVMDEKNQLNKSIKVVKI